MAVRCEQLCTSTHGQSHTSVIERRRTRATITQALCSTPLLDARVLLVDPRLHSDKIGDGGLMKNIPFSCLKKEMKWSLLGRGLSVCLTSSGGSEGDTSVEVIVQFAFKFKKNMVMSFLSENRMWMSVNVFPAEGKVRTETNSSDNFSSYGCEYVFPFHNWTGCSLKYRELLCRNHYQLSEYQLLITLGWIIKTIS